MVWENNIFILGDLPCMCTTCIFITYMLTVGNDPHAYVGNGRYASVGCTI